MKIRVKNLRMIKRLEAIVFVAALVSGAAALANWIVHGWAWTLPTLQSLCLATACLLVSRTASGLAKEMEGE